MRNPLRRDPLKLLHDEISALDARHEILTRQRAEAGTTLDAARKAAHEALLDGRDFDDAELAAAERRVAVLDDALGVLQDRREETQARIDEAQDKSAREVEAATRETAAAVVEKAAARVDDLIATLAEEFEILCKTVPSCVEVRTRDELFGDGALLSANRLAAQIIADAMHKHMPQIFDHEREELGGFQRATLRLLFRKPDASLAAVRYFTHPTPLPLSAQQSAQDLVVDPLVASAQRIRVGEDHAGASAPRDVAPHSGRNVYNSAMVDALASREALKAAE